MLALTQRLPASFGKKQQMLSTLLQCMLAPRLALRAGVRVTELQHPDGGTMTNPSIIRHDGKWLIATRRPWYRINPDGTYIVGRDIREFSTSTVLIECDDKLVPQTWQDVVVAPSLAGTLDDARNGLEDPRLFEVGGRLHCFWSGLRSDSIARVLADAARVGTRLVTPDWSDTTSTMMLAGLQGNEITTARSLRSPFGRNREKNWMPFGTAEQSGFVYSVNPMLVFDLRTEGPEARQPAPTDEDLVGWSGSSQLVPWNGGWLAVIHKAHRDLRGIPLFRKAVYTHRFLHLDASFGVVSMSSPFRFQSLGIEFCSGLAIKDEGVVISYGVDDRRAMLMEMPRTDVEKMLVGIRRKQG